MKAARPPWSWVALTVAALLLGVCLILATFFVASFRQGLDADGIPRMMRTTVPDLLVGIPVVGLAGSPFIVLGWWLARLSGWKAFPLLVAGPPVGLMFANQAFWIVEAALEPPTNIMPFEANAWTYLPNWLTLVGIGASFLFASVVYTKLAHAMRGSGFR
ncbi:MAG TPA: hypothetical protein VNZ85_14835 [Caulobacter sp.]|nr:hypothetical protein [Caulobacter sp.]